MNQLTEKDLKVQKRTISLLLTQRKRGEPINEDLLTKKIFEVTEKRLPLTRKNNNKTHKKLKTNEKDYI